MNTFLNTINELKQKRAKAIADARSILEGAEAAKREMSAEERTNYDKAYADGQSLNEDIKRYEQMANEERSEVNVPDNTSIDEKRHAAFSRLLRSGNGVQYAQEMRALQMDNPAQAGYLVAPEKFMAEVIKDLDNTFVMRNIARKFTLDGAQSLGFPKRTARMNAAAWGAEIASAAEDSTLAYGKREFVPRYMSALIKVSKPLIMNAAVDAEAEVRSEFVYDFGETAEQAYMSGDGVNKPLGIFTASADGISTDRDVSGSNTTTDIAADTLRDMKYKLKEQYRKNASWIFHRDAVKMISKLKDGNGQYLWQPGLKAGDPDMILNLALRETEYAPNTFTTGLYVGMLGDMSNYWIADSLGFDLQVLVEKYALTNQIGYVGRMQTDGMPVVEEAFARMVLA